jgi:hypothetical protein
MLTEKMERVNENWEGGNEKQKEMRIWKADPSSSDKAGLCRGKHSEE